MYFGSLTTAAVAPANDSWSMTAGAGAAMELLRKADGSTAATVTSNNTGTVGNTILLRQYVSEPLPYAMTITGKVFGVARCIESNASASHTLAVSIRACSNDGSTIRTPSLLVIRASDNGSVAPYEMGSSLSTTLFYDSGENSYLSLTNCDVQEGDRIVVEVGYRNGSTTTTRTGGVNFGAPTTTDLAYQTTLANIYNPWIEFTADLFVKPGAAYFG